MLAGRELDCLVAVHVVGAKHSEAVEREWMHFPETGPFADCDCEGHMAAQICPHYSTDIGAAWQVVEKLRPEFLFDLTWWHKGEVQIRLYRLYNSAEHYEASAPTAPPRHLCSRPESRGL